MKIDILTLFPQMFSGPFDFSIVKRAREKKLVELNIYDLRDWADDKYKSVDDRPYGGGPGMVMRVDVIDAAVKEIKRQKAKGKSTSKKSKVLLMDATGEKFTQGMAEELSREEQLILICGHYEGVDHRVHEYIADEVISVGDYVLSGGEIPTMVIVDSVVRLLPGSLGNPESLAEESFSQIPNLPWKGFDKLSRASKSQIPITEYPQYTRPEEYKGWRVPEVLLGGNHKKIEEWRRGI